MRNTPKFLFQDGDLHSILRNQLTDVKQAVNSIPKETFLTSPDDTLIEHIFSKMEIIPLSIFEDQWDMEENEIEIDVRHDQMRHFRDRSQPCMVPGLQVIVSIPFTGDPTLWKLRPHRYTFSPPRAQIRTSAKNNYSGFVDIIIERPSDSIRDGTEIQRELNDTIKGINSYIEWICRDVSAHNQQLHQTIRQQVTARRSRLGIHSKIAKSLNIPLKKKSGAPDMDVIPIRKRIVKPLPSRSTQTKEPGIAQTVYEYILKIIRHEGRSFEATPMTLQKLDEEDMRNIILAHLNGHLEGQATGETFRKKGKTDIRIEEKNRAAFVAECKLWNGSKGLKKAMDQLLSYITWRDCKAALIIFNTSVKGFQSLQTKVEPTMKNHDHFIRAVPSGGAGEWRFLFHSENDPEREVTVHIFLFDLYVNPRKED